MIARFIDGPLRGTERETPDATDYIEAWGSSYDGSPYGAPHYVYVRHGVEQWGRVQLFRLTSQASLTRDDLPLTDADQEMLRGMRIKV